MASRNQIAEIPVGRLGLNASADVANMAVGYLTIARNISFASGSMEKEAGADRYNDVVLTNSGDAWTLSGASYDSKSFDTSSEDSSPTALVLGNDGATLFVLGNTNDAVYQYTLSVRGDLSSASYDSVSLDVSAKDTDVQGLAVSGNGKALFVIGASSDKVYQYDLSTAWDLSSASDSGNALDVSGQTTAPTDVAVGDSGARIYVLAAGTIYQYTMSTADDLSTASYDSQSFSVASQDNDARAVRFQDTGEKLFILGNQNNNVYQYSLQTVWELDTAVYDSSSFSVGSQETAPQGLAFRDDGTKFYVIGATAYQYSASGTPVIVRQGHDWWPDFSKQRMIVFLSDGTIRRDEGGGSFPDTIKSGLSDVDNPYFVDGGLEASGQNRKLFIFTGANQVQVLSGDGLTTSNLTTPPADWSSPNFPTVGVIHEGRMWGTGNANDPHRLYYSTIDDHEDFTGTGAGSLSVYPGFGQRITAMASFKGFLIVWKDPRGMYVVDTADGTPSNWRVFQSTDSVGCLASHLVQHVQDGIMFLDHVANLWFLSAVDATGNVAIERPLPERQIATYVRDNINFGENASKARMSWYPNKMELHIALAGTGSTINNRDIVLDLNGDTPRFRVNERDIIMALFQRDERGIEKPVFGNDVGFIYLMDRESREKDDAGYEARFRTPPFDFSHADPKLATLDKNGQFLEIAMQPLGDWTLTVDLIWDGSITDTVTFNLGSNQAVLGQFVLGTDELSGDQVANKKARILGSGRRLELDGHNSGKGQNFSLSRFFIHYTPGAP